MSKIEPHVERMIVEKAELEEKLNKLSDFRNSAIFALLDPLPKGLLEIQFRAMQTYLECLDKRINLT